MQLPSSRLPKQFKGWSKKRTFNVKLIPAAGVQAWDTEWDGGSKNTYWYANVKDGAKYRTNPYLGEFLPFPGDPNLFILEDSCFCGKDMPLTFYVQPEHPSLFGVTAADVLDLMNIPTEIRSFPLNQLHDWLLENNNPRSKTTERYLSKQTV